MKTLEEGSGPLFMSPDPDEAREFFRTKNRSLVNKTMTVSEAVRRFIPDGCYLACGGFGANRIATALLHEIVRQGRKNLGFSGHTATHDCQILAAGECFNRCDVAYVIGLEARGLSPSSRRYFESGKVRTSEWSNAGLYWRYLAASLNAPFVAARTMLGTDTLKYSAAKVVEDPYTKKPVALFPALYPDVALIHVHEADIHGNARIKGIDIADHVLARASKKVILTAERLIHTDEIRMAPSATHIPYYLVDAVIEVPFGSYPGNMPYEYYSDEDHLRKWLEAEKDPDSLKKFLERFIYGTKDFFEYLELCGGMKKLQQLRWTELNLPVKPGPAGREE
jgi:glutaconate CoA-transferase subunit A